MANEVVTTSPTPTTVELKDVLSFIDQTASTYAVDPFHAKGILLAENMGQTGEVPTSLPFNRISPRGASGLMQVMPATRQNLVEQGILNAEHGTSNDWRSNVHAGLAAIKEIQGRRKTSDPRVIAAEYNAGPRGGQMVIEGNFESLPSETIDYLKRYEVAQGQLGGVNLLAPGTQISDYRGRTVSTGAGTGADIRRLKSVTTTTIQGAEALEKLLSDNAIFTQQATEAITQSTEQQVAAHEKAATSAVVAGQQTARAEELKAIIEAAGVQSRERILDLLKLDTRDTDNIVASRTAEFNTLEPQRQVLDTAIDEREAVGFFDNPLQYLINQTVLPGMLEQRNALARRQNESIEIVKAMQGVAETQQRIDIAASADQIAGLGVAIGNAKAAQANAAAEVYKSEAASATARGVVSIANLYERKLDNELKVRGWMKTVEREADPRNAAEREADADLEAKLKIWGPMAGMPQLTLRALKLMSAAERNDILMRVSKNHIGGNLYDVITFVDQGMLSNMKVTGSASVSEFLRNVQTRIFHLASANGQRVAMTPGAKVPPREELLQQAARDVESEFFASRNNMLLNLPNSPLNPYKANHSAMATAWKGDPENLVYKIVRDGEKNRIKYNDASLFSSIFKMVEAGTVKPAVAAQAVSDYYAAVVDRNNSTFSFNLFGMGRQDDYRMLPKESKQIVNMLSPIELENLFTTTTLAARVRAIEEAYGGIGLPTP